ncbi:hypothetical protein PRtIB026_A26750 [Pseudomonas sp. RtIB026]|nr:T6SS effector BTH_I2691 family protein [Pseudomonas sp. RtIB026]BDU09792.1 hypothetical protein PRtIB026_A26750 [Pseudomonas sp. RtIB026]
MFDFNKLLEITRQACEALEAPFASGPAVHCTRTFTILPLRYAAVGGTTGQRLRLPTLPDHLRHPYSVATLQHADYAIRPLRQGFLYVMEKRKRSGQHSLHPPYRIAANGSLSLVAPGQSEPDATDAHTLRDMIRNTALAFNVHDLEDLAELRLFYSPDPLTEAAQQQLLRRRDRLPAVDVAAFTGLGCPTPRPYVLRHDQLDLVADFAAETDSSLRKLLDNQLFSETSVHSLTAARYMLGPVAGKPEARGIAVVVEDAIGITQQLNAWRNAGMEYLKDWLEATESVAGKPGPSNERKVLVAQAFTELHQQFSERKVAALVDRHKEAMRAHLAGADQGANPQMAAWWAQAKEGILDTAGALRRQDLEARANNGEFARQFEARYLPHVDLKAMHDQLAWFESHGLEAQRLADVRADDHLAWLQSEQLLAALAYYDENDLRSGLCFAHQTGLSVVGMEGVSAGARLLAQWWHADTLTPDNLALRSFVFNQRAIAEVLEQTRQALQALPPEYDHWQQVDTSLKYAKELASQFSRVDGHLDQLAQHSALNTAGALAWLGQLGRQSLQAGAPGNMDRLLYRRLGTYLIASLGEQAINLRLSEHALEGDTPSRGRVAAPMVRRLDRAYVETLQGAHAHSFYRLRLASGLLLLEAGLLLLQGQRDDKDRRFWSEVVAAGLASAAAGFELLAVGTEQTLLGVGRNSAIARGADISLGRYRLWGAGLATVGGVVSITWDVSDAREATARSKSLLATTYWLRAGSTTALLLGQGGIAFSQASVFFQWLSMSANQTWKSSLYATLSTLSARLAANRAAMMFLSRLSWIGGAIVLGTTITLLIIDDDALEKWCSKCCFRLKPSDKGYVKDAEELEALFSAMSEVI